MGRHRSRHRRVSWPVVGLLAAAVTLFGAGAVLGPQLIDEREGAGTRSPTAAEPRCDASLQIVTAASFEPVLRNLAPALESGENCVRLTIDVADGRQAAARVAELNADVWIPDDAAWASQAGDTKLAEQDVAGAHTVVATSPIYMVTDGATADRVKQAGGGWLHLAELVANPDSGVRLVVRDPAGFGDGMLGVGGVGEGVWTAKGMDASSEALADAFPSTRTISGHALPDTDGEVGLVAEYALIPLLKNGDGADPKVRGATFISGSDNSAVLRYTWLPTADAAADPAANAPMERVLSALTGAEAADALASANLRRADVAPVPESPAQLPPLTAAPFDVLGAHHVEHVFATWYADERRANMLVVVDVSGSMGESPPESQRPLIELVREGVVTLTGLLPDESEFTLWKFGELLNPEARLDYQTVLPRSPLSGDGRKRLTEVTGQLIPEQTGTGLYDTILAAYSAARDAYQPGVPNHVVLFTDGRPEDDDETISDAQLAQALAAAKDDQRPVEFTAIVFGDKAVADTLEGVLEPVAGYVEATYSASAVRSSFIHAAAGGSH
jgi:Bacterial extracellular solute-binding protein/von Willebrand factor type A domain